jgi:hypothetical protein
LRFRAVENVCYIIRDATFLARAPAMSALSAAM